MDLKSALNLFGVYQIYECRHSSTPLVYPPGLRRWTYDSTETVERCPFWTFWVERCPFSAF